MVEWFKALNFLRIDRCCLMIYSAKCSFSSLNMHYIVFRTKKCLSLSDSYVWLCTRFRIHHKANERPWRLKTLFFGGGGGGDEMVYRFMALSVQRSAKCFFSGVTSKKVEDLGGTHHKVEESLPPKGRYGQPYHFLFLVMLSNNSYSIQSSES